MTTGTIHQHKDGTVVQRKVINEVCHSEFENASENQLREHMYETEGYRHADTSLAGV